MNKLLVTSYPKSQTSIRRLLHSGLSKAEQIYLKAAAKSQHSLLDLTGEYAYPDELKINPLKFASDGLTKDAEAKAELIAGRWIKDVQQILTLPWSGKMANRLSKAIEAELFRVLKEYMVAIFVTENAIKKLSPDTVTFLDPSMAAVVSHEQSSRKELGVPGNLNRVVDGSIECLRLLREARSWSLPNSDMDYLHETEFLVFSDMASQTRVLAPVINSIGNKKFTTIATDEPGLEIYSNAKINTLIPKQSTLPAFGETEIKTLIDIFRALKDKEFLTKHPSYSIFKSSWVRTQVILLLLQALEWEKFWQPVLQKTKPKIVLVSVAIWPAYRTLLDLASGQGIKTAIIMHGNIPAYPPYYSYPHPDLYCVFGEVYKQNLIKCGHVADNLLITGCTLPESNKALQTQIKIDANSKTPTIVLLQSPPGSEVNWLDYLQTVWMFVEVAINKPDWNFIVKLHPHKSNSGKEFHNFIRQNEIGNIEVVKDVPFQECLKKATAAVATYSTTVLDSLTMGVPVVIMRPGNRKPLMPFGEMGLASEAENAETLAQKLDKIINKPPTKLSKNKMAAFCSCSGASAVKLTASAIKGLAATS